MMLAAGARLGSYEVVGPLGAGGMGEVYRARDGRLSREVALKLLPEALAREPDRLARFEREAKLLAALDHPHIAGIHGLEESGGVPFLVLELVEGETLAERFERGPLPVRASLDLARQIAEAVSAAHEKGIVHRDLKPGNIKVTPENRVKVLDFGLAKALASDSAEQSQLPTISQMTHVGTVLGTPAYMSPEQARGQPVDRRTDVWAFGCVLYEALTGRRAFRGSTTSDTLAALLEREPEWDALPAATPGIVRSLLRRCLQKEKAQRLHDLADAQLEIEEGLRELSGAGVSALRPLRPWPHAGLVAGAVALGCLAGALAIWLATFPAAAENPLSDAKFARLTDFEGAETDAAISADGRFVAFVADREGSLNVWLSQVGTGGFVNLTKEEKGVGIGPIRNVDFTGDGSEVSFGGAPQGKLRLVPLMGGSARRFLSDGTVNVSWSPDGKRVVYHTMDPGDPMFVADRTGADARRIFVEVAGQHNHFPTWSQDGAWIYFARGSYDTDDTDLWRIRASGGEPERLTHHNSYVAYPAPIDARSVIYVARAEDGSGPWLWALDVERKKTRRVSLGIEQYTSVAASADGRRLAASVANPRASLWSVPILDRPAGEPDVKPFPLPVVRALMPRFGAASLFFLSSRGDGDGLWRYQDGQALEIWKGGDGALLHPPAVSPDARRVAVALKREGRLRLHLVSADGAGLWPLTEAIDVRGTACWSPDGKWIVTGGIDAQGPGLFRIPLDGSAPARMATGVALNPVWSPSGDLIVYSGAVIGAEAPLLAMRPDGSVVTLPEIATYTNGERARFLPDGKSLVYMHGSRPTQDFWLLDLATMKTRPLARLDDRGSMRTFDVTPDGKQIVFDRLQKNSDIVLIDLPPEQR